MCLYLQKVGSLIRDALEPRVRQFQEARYQKIQPKQRKDFTLTAPLYLEGTAHMRSVPKHPKFCPKRGFFSPYLRRHLSSIQQCSSLDF